MNTFKEGNDKNEKAPCTAKVEEILKHKGYVLFEKLGYGSYSRVFRAKHHNKDIACKVIDLEKTSHDYRYKFLPRELYTLKRLHHPNIVCVYDILTFNNIIYILMDLADGGDILDYLKANGSIPEEKAKIWFKQVCDALRYVHSNGIAHRDIKLENILLDKQGNAKLTDFGFSRICFELRTGKLVTSETYCGSLAYIAPEIIRNIPYNPMLSDSWSMGVVLFVMVNDSLPFEDSNITEMLQNQIQRKWSFISTVKDKLSLEIKDLINSLLEPDVAKRCTINKALRHKWLTNVRNTTPALAVANN